MRVVFFLPLEADLERLAALDPDAAPREFQRGERNWILQAHLRLAAAGFPSELGHELPTDGLVVFHAKHERELLRVRPRGSRAVLVGVRADNRQPLAAEFEIVQNRRWANDRERHYVAHWPQPGLQPRDPARGERFERVAYKGLLENLAPELLDARWRTFLAARGIEWTVDAVAFRPGEMESTELAWSDYTTVDAVVGLRPPSRRRAGSKPASKLVNAWLAGVPALLGPEPAYRELRRSPLDYLEVAGLAEAEAAIERLRADAGLRKAMAEQGRRRAGEHDVDAVAGRWIELLGSTLPRLAAARRRTRRRGLPLGLRRAGRLLGRWTALRPAR